MQKLVRRIIESASRRTSRAAKRLKMRYSLPKKDKSDLAFVLGCQRSGTTMLIDLLGRSSFIYAYGEMDAPIMKRNCRISSYKAIERELGRTPAHLTALKPICDSQWGNDFLDKFPEAKIVWIYRNFNDVINSTVKKFGQQDERMQWFADEDWDRLGWRVERVRKDHPIILLTQNLCRREGANRTDAAGLMWALRTGLYYEMNLNQSPNVTLIKYEALVADPETQIRKICDFLNIEFEPKLTADVHSRSVSKSEAPSFHPEVASVCQELQRRLDEDWKISCANNDSQN